jgi:hypothetical protein
VFPQGNDIPGNTMTVKHLRSIGGNGIFREHSTARGCPTDAYRAEIMSKQSGINTIRALTLGGLHSGVILPN